MQKKHFIVKDMDLQGRGDQLFPSAWLTQQCLLFDGCKTPLAISVSQRLDHAFGTHYLLNYNNLTVLENSNYYWRHTCSGTTALC